MANGEAPTWNVEKEGFLDIVFDFTNSHLQDDDTILLFHTDSIKLKAILKGFLKVYHFKVHKEWMDVNQLRMTSAREVGKTASEILQPMYHVINSFWSNPTLSSMYILTVFLLQTL
jgi:hypothetical protein